jgi:hypothetical protein
MISFDEFWKQYPRRVGRKLAERKWRQMSDLEHSLAIEAVKLWKLTEQWQRDGGKFIPYGSTFLNQARWLDEPWENAFRGKPMPSCSSEKGLF